LNAGAANQSQPSSSPVGTVQVIAPSGATSLKCPSCGAPIAPKFGEMIITCEYCGSSITLGNSGWANIEKQTMLPLKIPTTDEIASRVKSMMDRGLLSRHLQESSTLEEMTLSLVPYWLVAVSARTSIVATDMVAEGATVATTAALFGVLAGGMGGGRRGGFGGAPLLEGAMLGSMMNRGAGGSRKTMQMNENYNFLIIALKALTTYQPHDYQFALEDRTLFDISQFPKGIKTLNGDISENAAKYQAKTLVDQLQSQKAHAKYHMIQQISSEEDVSDAELLHAPIWFARYDHKGNKIILVVDGNSGNAINSMGL
jgi:DNA-directed RNA polymerase subunit RPC12/RpoP